MSEVTVVAPSAEDIAKSPDVILPNEAEPIVPNSDAPSPNIPEDAPLVPPVTNDEGNNEEAPDDATLGDNIQENNKAIEDTTKVINDNKVLTDKGINFETLTAEYNTKGELSEETYKALEDGGFPKSVVNAYIAGQTALADQYTNAVYASVGGKDNFGKMSQFIKAEGPEAVKAYNNLVDSGNLSAVKMYLEGVQAKMTLRNGTANASILGGGSVQVGGFESPDDMMVAMNDKRYGTNDKFTQDVQTKMAKSQFIKFNQ